LGGCALLTRQPLVQYAVRERLALRHLVQVSLEDVELGHLLYLLVAHQAELDALTVRLGEQAGVLLSPRRRAHLAWPCVQRQRLARQPNLG